MTWKLGVYCSVLELGGAKVAEVPILAHLPCTSPSIARKWFDLPRRALAQKCTLGGSTNVPNLVGGNWPPPKIWGFKFAKIAIFRRPCIGSSSIAPNAFTQSRLASARKCSPRRFTNVPNLVGVGWPAPEIWGFKLAKIAILRRPRIDSSSIAPNWFARSRCALAQKCSPWGSTKLPILVGGRWPPLHIWGFKLTKIAISRCSDMNSPSIAPNWFARSRRALVRKCTPGGSTTVSNLVGVGCPSLEIWGFKLAKIAILRFSGVGSSSIAPNAFTQSRLALAQKYSPRRFTNVPNLVGGRWPPPEIWGFKLAKIAILRCSDIYSPSIAPKWFARSRRALRRKCSLEASTIVPNLVGIGWPTPEIWGVGLRKSPFHAVRT